MTDALAPSPLMPVYAPAPEVFVRGEGPLLFTDTGERYLDFIAGIAVNSLGHAHPKLQEALAAQAAKLWHLSNMFRIEGKEKLAQIYVENSFADQVFFTNSGTEAIEGLIKLVRKYHFAKGAPEKVEIIAFSGAFHGRTIAALNAAGNAAYLDGFGPRMEGFVHVPWGDHEALKAAINPRTAAILIEPVQGEGGCAALPDQCMRGLRELCDAHGILLALDEVQCGAGRTGKLWAYEWAGVQPDVMAVAKGVGGGFPLGALLATNEAAIGMVRGAHGSTYGGNPLAMAVGIAVMEEMLKPEFLEHVRLMANHLGQALEGLRDRHPGLVLDARGRGLLRGIKLSIDPKLVQERAREHRLLVGTAAGNVVRLAPPLVIQPEHLGEAVAILDQTLSDVERAA